MRPSQAKLADWPDTVQHVGQGRCYRCHRRVKAAAAQDQARTQALRQDLAGWLASRGRVDHELTA